MIRDNPVATEKIAVLIATRRRARGAGIWAALDVVTRALW